MSILKRVNLPLIAAVLSFFVAAPSHAEDIEIFTGLTGDNSNSSVNKANVLFMLDSSGSMRFPEAVEESRPDYDPNENYGSDGSANNDYAYVYDKNGQYTGMFVSGSNNHCLASKQTFSDYPLRPEHVDEALIWNFEEGQDEVPGTCEINTVVETKGVDDTLYNEWDEVARFSVSEGNSFRISATNRLYSVTRFFYLDSNGNKVNGRFCQLKMGGEVGEFTEGSEESKSCAGEYTMPEGYTGVLVRVKRKRVAESVPYVTNPYYWRCYFWGGDHCNWDTRSIEGHAYSNATIEVGIPDCEPGVPAVASIGNWQALVSNTGEVKTLECKADDSTTDTPDGVTLNDSRYPQYQEETHIDVSAPNYTAGSSDPNRVDWEVSSIPKRKIYPGNYHDYLQTSIADLVSGMGQTIYSTSNATDFCKNKVNGSYVNSGKWVSDGEDVFRCVPRIESLKKATQIVLDTVSSSNVGIGRFNSYEGGSIIAAVEDIEGNSTVSYTNTSGTEVTEIISNREKLKRAVASLPAGGNTPLQESMYEAYLYFSGGVPTEVGVSDDNRPEKNVAVNPLTTEYDPGTVSTRRIITDAAAMEVNAAGNTVYLSPIESQCQDNNVILFSDGTATSDTGRKTEIEALRAGRQCDYKSDNEENSNYNKINSGGCLVAVADAFSNNVVNTALPANPDGSVQANRVNVYTIAFGSSVQQNTEQLERTSAAARRPNSPEDAKQHYTATDTDGLVDAFREIFEDISSVQSDSFVAPAVSVNAFNRLQYRNELYYSLFRPEASPRWNGNFKKYKINSNGDVIGANLATAVDPDTGYFKDDAISFWSDSADGADVGSGGAASHLDVVLHKRKLFGSFKSLPSANHDEVLNISDVEDFKGALDDNSVTLGSASTVDKVVKWSLGLDIDNDLAQGSTKPNYFLGDNLHGTPYALDYALADSVGGSVSTHKDILFATTNQGMLHAIDARDTKGGELWAYVPDQDLFSNLGEYFDDSEGSDHTYGLDGEMTFDVERSYPDKNKITKAHLFLGQRRGGKKIFAIDVTNADLSVGTQKPVDKLYTIEGLPRMGQTWSKPVLSKINYCKSAGNTDLSDTNCSATPVLIFSGGYDPKYDTSRRQKIDGITGVPIEDADGNVVYETYPLDELAGSQGAEGNAIYIVERSTGKLLWMAGRDTSQISSTGLDLSKIGYVTDSNMNHSFPSEPAVIDADFDGVADLIYAIDISGQIFRFDFRAGGEVTAGGIVIDENDIVYGDGEAAKEVSGGVIADLGSDGENKRFYNTLDVSASPKTDTDLARYNLVTGSGYRAHPLEDEGVENKLYFVFDRNLQHVKLLEPDSGSTELQPSYSYTGSGVIDLTDLPTRNNNSTQAIDTGLGGAERHGFSIGLYGGTNEKMLNPTLTDEGLVLAVSYAPGEIVASQAGGICQKGAGNSALYQINLFTGESSVIALKKEGISSKPVVIEIEDTSTAEVGDSIRILVVGSELFAPSKDGSGTSTDGGTNVRDKPILNDSDIGKIVKRNWWERR